MKKIVMILLLLISSSVYAAEYNTGKCLINSGYVFSDDDFVANSSYASEISTSYNSYNTAKTSYSSISCREFMGINTDGNVKDVIAGSGFDYNVSVESLIICKSSFKSSSFNSKLPSDKTSTLYKAMSAEYGIYKDWANNLDDKIVSSITESISVTIDDSQTINSSIDSQMILQDTQVTEIKTLNNKKLPSTTSSTKLGTASIWIKAFKVTSTYIPIAKKMIISGPDYGTIVKGEYVTNYRCTNSENKIFTDYSMQNNNYPLQINVKNTNKSWTIISDCGYNIYNKGSVSKEARLSFRQISLNDPFPNTPGENWQGLENLITGDEFNKTPVYIVEMDGDLINAIRKYNDNYSLNNANGYATFIDMSKNTTSDNTKLNDYKSKFINETFANMFIKAGDN